MLKNSNLLHLQREEYYDKNKNYFQENEIPKSISNNSGVQLKNKQFKDDILKRRKDLLKADIEELAQGQIFSGEEAVKLGLADEVGGLWQAGRKIHAELALKSEFDLRFIKVKKALFQKIF